MAKKLTKAERRKIALQNLKKAHAARRGGKKGGKKSAKRFMAVRMPKKGGPGGAGKAIGRVRMAGGSRVLASGLPPRPKGYMTYQKGDKLIAKPLARGGKKGRKIRSGWKCSRA